jgi:hypothetical protein
MFKDALSKAPLKRRDLLKLGLAGAAISCVGRGCQSKDSGNPNPPEPPEQVFVLTDGRTPYDDFDGHGNLQTYNNQNLAEAGQLATKLWDLTASGPEVVQDPEAAGQLAVVNEEGQRVEYRRREGQSQETKYVYNAEGRLLQAVPHIPGEPYHSSKQLLLVGVHDGLYQTENGPLIVKRGKIYGGARLRPTAAGGWVLKMVSTLSGPLFCILANRREIEVADYKTFSADLMMPSNSSCPGFYASLSYHTTIPEQPPGLSWMTDLGIRKFGNGRIIFFAVCINRNTGYNTNLDLGDAQLDTWYNLKMDILTRSDDPTLGEKEFRIEYYIDGKLLGTEVPEDAELLLDPLRTGTGPDRLLRLNINTSEGEGIAYFDNVKGVYANRIS